MVKRIQIVKIAGIILAVANVIWFFLVAKSTSGQQCGSPLLSFPCTGPLIFYPSAIISLIVLVVLFIRKSFKKLLIFFIIVDILLVVAVVTQAVRYQISQASEAQQVGTQFYIPSYVPSGYTHDTTGVYLANDLGKFAPLGSKQFDIYYYLNGDSSHPLWFKETSYSGNFNPLTDCSTPASINVITPCRTLVVNGGQLYVAQGLAYYINGQTLIFVVDQLSDSELVKVINSLKLNNHPIYTNDCINLNNFLCLGG